MSHFAAPTRLLLAGAWILAACGLNEVFRPSRLGDVELVFVGGPDVIRGEQTPFSVTVTAGGTVVADPLLAYAVSDTAVMQLTADSTALIGVANGNATLTVQFLGSIFTDTLPTLIVDIRVRP